MYVATVTTAQRAPPTVPKISLASAQADDRKTAAKAPCYDISEDDDQDWSSCRCNSTSISTIGYVRPGDPLAPYGITRQWKR